MNRKHSSEIGDPEIHTTVAQQEMAFRMQTSVPDLMDISDEPKHVLDMYGPDVHKPGTFARCCLLARRMVDEARQERDVTARDLQRRDPTFARAKSFDTFCPLGPALVITPGTKHIAEDPQLAAKYAAAVPLGRIGLPEDMVGAVVYLCSDAASFVSGQTIYVDGGLTAA